MAAPPSPELAAPSEEASRRAKSSSLSEQSSKSPTPEAERESTSQQASVSRRASKTGPAPPSRLRTASISSALSALTDRRDEEEDEQEVDEEDGDTEGSSVPVPNSGRRRPPPKRLYTGSSDEGEGSVATPDGRVNGKDKPAEEENDDDESDFEESQVSPRRGGKQAQRRDPSSAATGSASANTSTQPRGRGRPRGSKKAFPASTRGPTRAAANGKSASAELNKSDAAAVAAATANWIAPPRATRATVQLPPGYIEGVKGSRWPNARRKDREGESANTTPAVTDDEEGSEAASLDSTSKSTAKGEGRAKEKGKSKADDNEMDVDVEEEDTKPTIEVELVDDAEREAETRATNGERSAATSVGPGTPAMTDATPTPTPEPVKEPAETPSSKKAAATAPDVPPPAGDTDTTMADSAAEKAPLKQIVQETAKAVVKEVAPSPTPSKGGPGRGKKGKKGKGKATPARAVSPDKEKEKGKDDKDKGKEKSEPPERSAVREYRLWLVWLFYDIRLTVPLAVKRRKLDAGALERAAARGAARVVFVKQLEQEEKAIADGSHPLVEATKAALLSEKNRRLRNMAKTLELKEIEYARVRDASAERVWREWAVSNRFDSLIRCDFAHAMNTCAGGQGRQAHEVIFRQSRLAQATYQRGEELSVP